MKWYDEDMRRTVSIFPELSGDEKASSIETRKQYARAFNRSTECLINNSSTSKRFLHKVQYERIKEECPSLPTGLIQCARDVAVEAVKTWNVKKTKLKQKKPKKAERMKRPSMKEKYTMRYDVRTVTLRGSQLTFSTCERRIKTIISIPEFFLSVILIPRDGSSRERTSEWTGKDGYSSISSMNVLIL